MKKNPRLTIGRARELIKRELGLSATSLTAPPEMKGNCDYSWYEMTSGNMRINLYTTGADHFTHCDMIALSVIHENSLYGVSEYFYADTMEYAPEYTEMKRREDICEIISIENDPALKRLIREADDAMWHHYNDCKKHEPLADSLPAAQLQQNLQNQFSQEDIEEEQEMDL